MNVTMQEIQIKVAQHMIQPNMEIEHSAVRNIVMQMHMGDEKTSVILPLLAVNLSSSNSSLVRIIVLKSLFPTNYQSLRCKLGGLLNRRIFRFACRRDMNFNTIDSRNYRYTDKPIILSFILETHSSVEYLVHKFPRLDLQLFLIIRGLLSSEVLLVAFKNRYRVNYGVNSSSSFNRLMTVPFPAKDVVADRTEFGHPDVALVLTKISYYYLGLNEEETDPASIYDQWILYEDEKYIPKSIKQWNEVNLKDYQQ
ncbi:unnamed protein product [Rotaria sp. Silwood1]|nr:unnamed protein product [Rotaria sp. Silwood1]CAF1683744.1 unnamed protein product [Rotaria sp. Silwood1]CAF5128959.1 unnamed protein product [Rotaria sp. Silwood1]